MSKDSGGPAFPSQYSLPGNQGVTLRDYFAAKAMEALIGAQSRFDDESNLSEKAYLIADAMIVERSK